MSKNRWADIYNVFKDAGISVYAPAQHKGECTSRYVVVKIGTLQRLREFSSVQYVYDILVYVPKDEYSDLETFVEEVKGIMKKLRPMIMPVNSQTGSFYDDQVKGHMISIQYRNNRRM